MIEWPPQHTTRFGLSWVCSTLALRRIWKTASVTPSVLCKSNFGLPVTSSLTKIMSRSTANRCSWMPLIILPSTKAMAGAPLMSSLMPRSRWMMEISNDW
ncbi:hypothetical protein D3C72_1468450 [compost metagenome]